MIAALLLAGEALARAGGGHEFSSGGGGSSGGGSFGGGGDGGDGGGLLVWLVIQHPVIGVPVLLVVVVMWVLAQQRGGQRTVHRTAARPPRAAPRAASAALREVDPNYSEPLFLDLARLVYTRAHEARGGGVYTALTPYLSAAVIAALGGRRDRPTPVENVVIGAARIETIEVGNPVRIAVSFEANLTEGTSKRLVRERWVYARSADVLSPGPERMRTLGCVACGSPIDTRADGSCRNCDAALADGRLMWQVVDVRVISDTAAPPLALKKGAGVEVGTDLPLVLAADLPAQLRALQARHPGLRWEALRARIVEVYARIQQAWSDGRWEGARPYETDFLFQQHRYWIERYAEEGLRNRMERSQVTDVVLSRVSVDAYLESVTVRIFARMRDWTERSDGELVSGSKTADRVFSEYWTFIRSAGKDARPRESVDACPSCSAPLDQVSATGVCGHCDAKITGGEYDWVLCSIDQDEAYRG